jgi:hypothetical protein
MESFGPFKGLIYRRTLGGPAMPGAEVTTQPEMSNFRKAEAAFRPLGLDNRALNALVRGGICSLDQLSALTELQASRIPGLGSKTLDQIRPFLKAEEPAGMEFPEDRTISIKFDAKTVAAIDAWLGTQAAISSRPVAVRHLVAQALGGARK